MVNPVRTMERVTTLSMTTDVTVWQASTVPIVIIVRKLYLNMHNDNFYENEYKTISIV